MAAGIGLAVVVKPVARRSTPRNPLFDGRWFEDEIIIWCLRWYFRYKLSYRDLVEMMGERGLPVAHTTILRWAVRYAEEFEKRWRRYERPVGGSWRADETYIKVQVAGCTFTARWTPKARPSTFI